MARNKIALQYFPIDMEIFGDPKIKRLIRHNPRGLEMYLRILTMIYGNKGYYLEVDDETCFDIADDMRMGEEEVREMIRFCAGENIRLFDVGMLEKHRILTSRGIQNTYVDAMSKLKRRVEIRDDYRLLDFDSFGEFPKKGPILRKNSEKCPDSSEEKADSSEKQGDYSEKKADSSDKKKIKEKKEKEIKNISLSLTPSLRSADECSADEPPQTEREDFLKILFFEKRILSPQRELDRFLSHYEKTGWLDANGNRIRNRQAALKAWTPAKDALQCPAPTGRIWQAVFEAVKASDPAADCTPLLTGFRSLTADRRMVHIECEDRSLHDFLELPRHIGAARAVFANYFPDRELSYRIPKTPDVRL